MTAKKHTIALRLDKELHAQITLAAQGRYMSVSAWLIQAVLDTLPAPVVGKPVKQTAAERKESEQELKDAIRAAVRKSPHGLTANELHAAIGGEAVIPRVEVLMAVNGEIEGLVREHSERRGYFFTVPGQTLAAQVRLAITPKAKEDNDVAF
ncbi:MAG: hypothetical protein NUW09_11120 [Deltaproteobacteria bacterium]|nr:hypothetical protein [Deltaproteobacteria bacterium]